MPSPPRPDRRRQNDAECCVNELWKRCEIPFWLNGSCRRRARPTDNAGRRTFIFRAVPIRGWAFASTNYLFLFLRNEINDSRKRQFPVVVPLWRFLINFVCFFFLLFTPSFYPMFRTSSRQLRRFPTPEISFFVWSALENVPRTVDTRYARVAHYRGCLLSSTESCWSSEVHYAPLIRTSSGVTHDSQDQPAVHRQSPSLQVLIQFRLWTRGAQAQAPRPSGGPE